MIVAFTSAFALGVSSTARADSIALTRGSLQLYLGDPGSADLMGLGFHVSSAASGSWPVSVRPGNPVNFSTVVLLSNWGQALINGAQLHGDTSGPGVGRVWISGTIHVAAVSFIAPSPTVFAGSFKAPMTLSGVVAGYSSADLSQPPLFTANVSGSGTASGIYRVIGNGNDSSYVDRCCASIMITDSSSRASPKLEPGSLSLLGAGIMTLLARRTLRPTRR